MLKTKIPKKPSALIRLALSDLRKVEKDKRYVLAKSLNVVKETYDVPKWAGALNHFRAGNIWLGFKRDMTRLAKKLESVGL